MAGAQEQLLRRTKDGSLVVKEDTLKKLLEQNEDLLDRKLIVISIVGKYRTGKSFFLNQVMKFLRNKGCENWLQKDTPDDVFLWGGGSKSKSEGISIWSRAFPFRDEYAVILMDTEGTYDEKSTNAQMSQVFGCSAFMSSIVIYNVAERITQQTMQEVEYFSEYGRSASECGDGNPFQKLMFLVRDWEYPVTCPFGLEGGDTILTNWMTDNESVSETIQKCFKNSSCYLMPFPGDNIADANQTIPYEEMDTVFRAHLEHLIESIFTQEMLEVKSVGGKELFLRDFSHYFSMIADTMMECVNIPACLFQNQIRASNMAAQEKALEYYVENMDKKLDLDKPYAFLRTLHEDNKKSALQLFSDIPKIGGNQFVKQYKETLIKDLSSAYERFKLRNEYIKSLLKNKEEKDEEISNIKRDMLEMKEKMEKENEEARKRIKAILAEKQKLEERLHKINLEAEKKLNEKEQWKDNEQREKEAIVNQQLQELRAGMDELKKQVEDNKKEKEELKAKLRKANDSKCIIA